MYSSKLTAHEHHPEVPEEHQYVMNERQWLLIVDGKNRCAFLHTYIACQTSRNSSFIQWNEDLFTLLTCEAMDLRRKGFVVFALGDFNSWIGQVAGLEGNHPDHNRNSVRFIRFLEEVNLTIINTLPVSRGLFSWFDDYGSRRPSLIDYGLIDKGRESLVTSFVIDEEARFKCGSDHALLLCNIQFQHRPKVNWQYRDVFAYNIRDNTNYQPYSEALTAALRSIPLHSFAKTSPGQMLEHITECIHDAAKTAIGYKVYRKRKKGHRLPEHVLSLIREKNYLVQQLSESSCDDHDEYPEIKRKLENIKSEIKLKIMDLRMKKRSRLRKKLLMRDPNRKKFWRLLKGQMTALGKITAMLNKKGEMVFKQDEVEEVVLDHFAERFSGQKFPGQSTSPLMTPTDDTTGQRPWDREHLFEPTQFESEVCAPFTYMELEDMLKELPLGKASGYDR